VLGEYKLPKSNVFLKFQDSGANMVAGVTDSGLQSHSCFIHTLQLSVSDSISALQATRTTITIKRNTVKHFNHSASAVNKLMETQEQLNLKKHKLIPRCTHSLQFNILHAGKKEQQKAFTTYAVDNNIPT
jgi:coenzyme F420-reducing hydrogenase delta subunit